LYPVVNPSCLLQNSCGLPCEHATYSDGWLLKKHLGTQWATQPPVPPSGSHKCLRFGLWSTLRTLKDLFTYLLTYLPGKCLLKRHVWPT